MSTDKLLFMPFDTRDIATIGPALREYGATGQGAQKKNQLTIDHELAKGKTALEVWFNGKKNPFVQGMTGVQIYIRGHGMPGENIIEGGRGGEKLRYDEVVDRLIKSGLSKAFTGKIKLQLPHPWGDVRRLRARLILRGSRRVRRGWRRAMKLGRRALISGVAGTIITRAGVTDAAGTCAPPGFPPACNAYADLGKIVIAPQRQTQWCWAATISMLFAQRGYPVEQTRIVQQAFGGTIANMPGQPHQILAALNRTWTDDNGRSFTARTNGLFSPDLGLNTLSNAQIIQALQQGGTLLYCNMSHAMALFQVNYVGPSTITAALVVDPMPGIGIRSLTTPEMMPVNVGGAARLLATVTVSAGGGGGGGDDSSTPPTPFPAPPPPLPPPPPPQVGMHCCDVAGQPRCNIPLSPLTSGCFCPGLGSGFTCR